MLTVLAAWDARVLMSAKQQMSRQLPSVVPVYDMTVVVTPWLLVLNVAPQSVYFVRAVFLSVIIITTFMLTGVSGLSDSFSVFFLHLEENVWG